MRHSLLRCLTEMLVAGAVLVILAAPVHAAILSFSDTHVLSPTDWVDQLTVSQFDPAQGTLNSIKITFLGQMFYDVTFDNDGSTPAIAAVNVETIFGIPVFPGLPIGGLRLENAQGSGALAPDDSNNKDSPGDGGPDEDTVIKVQRMDNVMETVTPISPDFASFLGTGALQSSPFGTQTFVTEQVNPLFDVDILVFNQGEARLTVDYDFDPAPVPIPSATLLFGTGLVGLITLSRRNMRRE